MLSDISQGQTLGFLSRLMGTLLISSWISVLAKHDP
jgi:hypothetical protein